MDSQAPQAGASGAVAAGDEDGTIFEVRPVRRHRVTRFTIWRRPLNLLALVLVVTVVAVALIGEAIAPYSPVKPDYGSILIAPSLDHLFGTDEVGRDVFSRVLSGARLSLEVGVIVVGIGAFVGTALGLIAGYAGGWVDEGVMRMTDVFLAFPVLVLAMAIAATLGPSVDHTILALTALWWPWYVRLIRGQVLSLREREYIEAARAVGVSPVRIMRRHLVPNILAPLLVQVSLDLGYAILAASSLSFIGLGVQPPAPDWGLMISDAQAYLRTGWWVATFPGLALVLTVIGFNLMGDIVYDLLDPRYRSR
jgi:peptide/nickel transport system permease protein